MKILGETFESPVGKYNLTVNGRIAFTGSWKKCRDKFKKLDRNKRHFATISPTSIYTVKSRIYGKTHAFNEFMKKKPGIVVMSPQTDHFPVYQPNHPLIAPKLADSPKNEDWRQAFMDASKDATDFLIKTPKFKIKDLE